MANIEITNNKTRGIVIRGPVFADDSYRATAAGTVPQGAVLARETSTGFLKRFDPAGADGLNVPLAVLSQECVYDAAGDYPVRPVVGGQVRRGDLLDLNDTALTQVAVDQLRDYSIIALSTTQLAELDNQ